MTNKAKAQGIERESISGENIAAQMRQSGIDDEYNLRLGPVTLRAEADIATSFNNNINLANTGRIADILITPSSVIHARWKVSDLNTLNLDFGIGYQMYLIHSQYDSLLLSPDSEAEFNFFAGDVLINLHDSFSYQQDPTQIGQLSNTTQLSRFQNDFGIRATWDLNDLILSIGYDHANLWVTQSAYDYLTDQSDTVAPKITIKVDKTIDAGIITSFSAVRYAQNFQNNFQSFSIGPFTTAQITDKLTVTAQAGGYFSNYAKGGGNGDSQNISSYYGSAGVTHRINESMQESLTVGREFLPGLTSNFTERTYANYTNSWQATPFINVGANLWWEYLIDSNAPSSATANFYGSSETSNRYGFGLNINDNITKNGTLNFNYQFILKDANPSTSSYVQNLLTFGYRYQF